MEEKSKLDRALGALAGGALGDALGMPTEGLSPQEIALRYGCIDDFAAPAAEHPFQRDLPAGTVTDDTEQTLLLAQVLLESGGRFEHGRWTEALLSWEADVEARGVRDLLGPSTKRAIEAIARGVVPEEAGRFGDTNGAAMRIAPVGIATPPLPLEALVERVAETCRATHNTGLAIASAAAVAAAVSCGVEGGDWREARRLAVAAAEMASRHGHWVAGADIAARIEWACELVEGRGEEEALARVVRLVGTSVAAQESVPAAFAVLSIAQGEAWKAARLAANLGGDTDTIGAIAAGMAGACSGAARLPQGHVARLRGFDMGESRRLAAALLERRAARGGEG